MASRNLIAGPPLPARPGEETPARSWLAGPWPGVLAAVSGSLALAGIGFSVGAIYASRTPVPVALAVVEPESPVYVAGIGGPDEPLAPASGQSADLLAEAVRHAVAGRDLAATNLGRPVLRPVEGGWVSSGFGRRVDPFTGREALHQGLDFAGLRNSVITASGAGVVTRSGGQRGYGNLIEIDHGDGFASRYGHNASNLVAVGDHVKAGQVIALMGASGRATGNHLHFEILKDGRPVNPARFIPRR
jgi:murein DD-endopeptidase MepM/ murein hydrolase activator NlpD